MSKGINKVILIGNLGQAPELRYLESGIAVANLNLATNEAWRDKDSGERQERTEWHRVVFFNRLAEVVGEYLHKGSQVYVEGSLRTRKWQDADGADRYTTEIIASDMQMLGSAGDTGAPAHAPAAEAKPKAGKSGKPAPKRTSGKARTRFTRMPAVTADDDDGSDIPF